MDKTRLLKALAVSALCLVLFGTVLGAAQADGEEPEPAPVSIAFPRPGDRAEYQLTTHRVGPGIPGVSMEAHTLVAEWLPASTVLGSDGAWHAVRSLRVGVSYAATAPWVDDETQEAVRTAHYDLRTGEVVAMDHNARDGATAGLVQKDERGPFVSGDLFGTSGTFHLRDLKEPGHLCGFDTPMHRHPVPVDEKVWLGPCSARSGDLFVFGGVDEVDGVAALRYDHRGDGSIHAWYNPGYSLPLRLATALADLVPSNLRAGYVFDARLTEAAVGNGFYGAFAQRDDTVAPARLAPRTPLGPSTAGVTQPFPLADAVAAARADEQAPTVSGFLRRNPDAYLAAAFPHQYADEYGRTAIDWFLLWTDGEDLIAKFVRQGPQRSELDALGLGRGLTVEDADAATVPTDPEGLYPTPDRLPDRLPTVADAMRLHQAHHPGPAPDAPLYWGFAFGCTDDCAGATFHLLAGTQQRPRDPEPGGTGGTPLPSAEWIESVTAVDGDGAVERTVDYEQRPTLPAVAPGTEPEAEGVPEPTAITFWSALTPAATTGAGLAALLAGLAYYFWPHLKLAAAGLFSRIRHEAVLDHPQRSRLDELVRERPGIHFQELARAAELGRGVTEHHLRKLCESGRVVAHVGAGYTCYFPRGVVDRRVMAAAPVLKSEGARAVLREVVAGRASSVRAVAEAAGMGRSTVGHHLKRLRDAGLVEDARPGYRAAGHARQALALMA